MNHSLYPNQLLVVCVHKDELSAKTKIIIFIVSRHQVFFLYFIQIKIVTQTIIPTVLSKKQLPTICTVQ